jgi:transcriptional regulator with XRE-family HTH domain
VETDALREAMCSEIAQLLKKERLRRKLSLNLISSKAGLSRQTVSFIEREERTPTVDTLLRLTAVLEIKLEALIRRARKQALAKSPR